MTSLIVAELPEDAGRDLDVEISILGPDVDIVRYSCDGDDRGLISACRDADVLGEVSLSVGLIKHAPLLGLDIQSVLGTLKNDITVFGPIPGCSERCQ
jgi:hypothetical protein